MKRKAMKCMAMMLSAVMVCALAEPAAVVRADDIEKHAEEPEAFLSEENLSEEEAALMDGSEENLAEEHSTKEDSATEPSMVERLTEKITTEDSIGEGGSTEENISEENTTEETVLEEISTETETSSMEDEAEADDDVLKLTEEVSGTDGNISWNIDVDGNLTVTGTGDWTGWNPPWYDHRSEIKTARVTLSEITSVRNMFYDCKNLIETDLSGLDTSSVIDMSNMFYGCYNLKKADVSGFNTSNVIDMSGMFEFPDAWFVDERDSSLISVDVSKFDTSNVINMSGMFAGCNKLTNLDVSNFNTSNVEYMDRMFEGCSSLTSLDVSNFNTSNVEYMERMFRYCSSLTSLNLSNFNTLNVLSMEGMFYSCEKLMSLDVSKFDTSKVKKMHYMFGLCNKLSNLDVSSFDTSNVDNMNQMFVGCKSLAKLDVSNFNTSNVTDMYLMFHLCENLETLDLSSFDASNATNMTSMFSDCSNLTKINTPRNVKLSVGLPDGSWYDADGAVTELPQNLNYSKTITKNKAPEAVTPHITAIKYKTAYSIGSAVDISDLVVKYYKEKGDVEILGTGTYTTNAKEIDMNTEGEKTLTVTYNGMTADIKLTVSQKGTDIAHGEYKENGNDITWTISADGKLTVEGKGDFLRDYYDEDFVDTARPSWLKYRNQILTAQIKVTGMTDASHMFEACNNLTSVDLSGLDTSKVTNMSAMFYGCWSLASVDLSGFDTSKVTDMEYMFACCFKLKSVDLSNFNTSNVTRMFSMFMSCDELTSVNLSSFDIRKVTSTGWMFIDCGNLRSLDLSSFDASNTDMSSIFGMAASPCEPDTLYTPRNVKQEVELYKTMYDTAGNAYDILPMNREDSILLQSGKQPEAVTAHIVATKLKRMYVCGETLNTDDITVKYYGTDGSVKELAQTDYTTNAPEIDMGIEGEKTLTVTYNNMTADIKLTVSKKEESGGDEEDMDDSPYADDERTAFTASNTTIAAVKSKVYDGEAYTPAVKVLFTAANGKKTTLTEGADYRVLYKNNINVGTGSVIVRGNGIYKGEVKADFTITSKPLKKLKIVAGAITATQTKDFPLYIYDGGKRLTEGTDYILKNDLNVNVKKTAATITVEGKGNYEDTVSAKFTVYVCAPDKLISAENVTLTTETVEYTGKAIKDIVKDVTIGSTKLDPKKDYKVQYQNNKGAGTAYAIITGKGEYKGKAVKTFTILAEENELEIKPITKKLTYSGKLQKPAVTVTAGGKKLSKKDYTVTYKNNFHAGTATVIVTGKGNHAGKRAEASFIINRQEIKKASVKGTKNNLVLTYSKQTLKEGTDYEISAYGAENKNKVEVTIRGKGDFTGEVTKKVKAQ